MLCFEQVSSDRCTLKYLMKSSILNEMTEIFYLNRLVFYVLIPLYASKIKIFLLVKNAFQANVKSQSHRVKCCQNND